MHLCRLSRQRSDSASKVGGQVNYRLPVGRPMLMTQGPAVLLGMIEVPWRAIRRLAPDPVQFQIILGSLLGDGRLVGDGSARRLRIAHAASRAGYVHWKYDRLAALSGEAPVERNGVMSFTTVAHPLFDDLAALRRQRLVELIAPLGLAVWMTDLGRLEMRPDAFLPTQRSLALAG